MTLVYEHVHLSTTTQHKGALTLDQFHALIDGALRQPPT
jgi:hypothetical protein